MKKSKQWFNSLLVLTMIFTLLFPLTGAAETKATKAALFNSDANSEMKLLIAKQKAALRGAPKLHPDLQNVKDDEEVAVIVELKDYPVALVKGINKAKGKTTSKTEEQSIQQKLISQQAKFKTNVNAKGIKAKYGFSYNYAFNGMALKLKGADVKKLLKVEDVALIEPDVEMHAMGNPSPSDVVKPAMNTSSPFLNVPAVWQLGYQGQGVKVAVLDTGIDYNHPEFQGVYKGGYNFIDQSNSNNYARTRAANDPYETSPLDRPASQPETDADGETFYTQHGTHVAGTIAAQGNNNFNIKGIAPKVELYAYRVLGAFGSGSNSGIIAAIDKAVQEKMDIINLSLGGSNNSQVSSDAIAINNAALAGVTACIATGNEGPGRGTIGSPGVAAFAISVGNSTVPEKTMAGQASVSLNGAAPTTYSMNLMGWKFGTNPAQVLTGTYDLVAVPNYGVDADYAKINVVGKVALVSRGNNIPFVEKIAAAKKAGAVAVIIHNNVGTTAPSGIYLGDSFQYIPTFDMSTTDGKALRTALSTKTGKVTFGNFTTGTTTGDDVNDSSSQGPANPNFDLKPDVVAPGTDIMSSVPAYGKDYPNADYSEAYDRFTGTSMATPHITGIAALLKSQHPTWTPFDIKVAISNTAKQLDVTKYDVFAQGPGRVQPYQAATAQALAYSLDTTSFSGQTYENIKGTITFGNVTPNPDNAITITKTVKVKNLTTAASNYTVSVQKTKSATDSVAAASVTVDKSSFTLDASGEKLLTVTLNVPAGSPSLNNEILGYVKITNGTTNLNLPFAANFSPPTGLKSLTVNSSDISPNGDGKMDGTTLNYEFYDDQLYTALELWDALDPTGHYYEDGYAGSIYETDASPAGPQSVDIDGTYYSYDTDDIETAADGVYTLDLSTFDSSDPYEIQGYVTQNWVGPFFVKTTAPSIVGQSSNTTDSASFNLTGSVQDSYVDWQPLVADMFDEGYDVNTKLFAKYEVTNAQGVKVGAVTPFALNQDGSFNVSLTGLTDGDNKVNITVTDAAGNTASKQLTVTKTASTPVATPGVGKLVLNGNPLANIQFAVYTAGATKVWYDFKTDETGTFKFNLPDGDYKIDGVWVAPTWYPLNGSFTIKNGLVNGTTGLVINAEDYQIPQDANNITGTLTKNGEAFANIPFAFHTADGKWYDTRTDSKGNFAFQVPDGTYQIDGIWDGPVGKWYVLNQSFTVSGGKLSGAANLQVNVTAAKLSSVTGKLTQGGVGLGNIQFAVHTTTGDTQWYDAFTDANGNFNLVLPDGAYRLEGIWVGAENKWYAQPQDFTVSGPSTFNISLPAAPAKNVTGVLSKGGAGLGGVQFAFHNGDQWYDVVTNADGSFGTILPDGTYTIEGIWLPAEWKWYVLGSQFTVQNGKLVGQTQVNINLQ